jgi:uncharacterized protein YdeI (YjbR/CyaY-like superfamily)
MSLSRDRAWSARPLLLGGVVRPAPNKRFFPADLINPLRSWKLLSCRAKLPATGGGLESSLRFEYEIHWPIRETPMGTRDARVDDYLAKSADFARPILTHLRDLVHAACPDVEETMKWSFPHFMYKGMLCSMASFKEHCAFGFWKSSLIVEKGGAAVEKAMGQFGRITQLSDLPSNKILSGYIKDAMKLNEAGVKAPSPMKPKTPKAELVVPDDLASALQANQKAKATFENFSPSQKREYVE